jgi:SAM-dependent methyltransferase
VENADVETSSEGYARRFEGPVGEFFLDVQTKGTLELLQPWRGGTILDVGGGHGQITGPLVEAGFDVTVFGSEAICEARIRSFTQEGRVRFCHGDLLAFPFDDRSFDVVVSYRLLPHVTRWRELVAQMGRVARQVVLVDYPTKRSVNAVADAFFGMKKGIEKNTRPFAVFADRDVVSAFGDVGWRPSARRPQFFFPMALHRGLGRRGISSVLEAAAGALGLVRTFGSPVLLRLGRG